MIHPRDQSSASSSTSDEPPLKKRRAQDRDDCTNMAKDQTVSLACDGESKREADVDGKKQDDASTGVAVVSADAEAVESKRHKSCSSLEQPSHPFWTQARRWVHDPADAARCRCVCRAWNMTFAQPVHPRDKRLRFDEPSHTYFIDGKRGQLKSVTTWIHTFFPHFDADDAISKMRRGRKWNEDNPLFGKTNDEIKLIWKLNGEAASKQGKGLENPF